MVELRLIAFVSSLFNLLITLSKLNYSHRDILILIDDTRKRTMIIAYNEMDKNMDITSISDSGLFSINSLAIRLRI